MISAPRQPRHKGSKQSAAAPSGTAFSRTSGRWLGLSGSPAKITRVIGVFGTLLCMVVFLQQPSWPTPDKLLVFMTFVFLCFGQALEMLKRFVPFVGLLLVYESFRGIADGLNTRVNFMFMVDADRLMFGGVLPTTKLQEWWWNGQVQWYDFVFYVAYMLHFVLPIALAIVIWKKLPKEYWRYVTAFVVTSFIGFLTYIVFPAAPPWMASDLGMIEPITRVSSSVWGALGIQDFPSLYNDISPNPVAAVPSLHAAYATLFAMFAIGLFRSRWRYLALLQPFLIYLGTVYQGEHYAFDEIVGALLAVAVFYTSAAIVRTLERGYNRLKKQSMSIIAKYRPKPAHTKK